ncbi:MAG: phosphoribosylformylglycinamidine synthase subunit PurQ [Verrucomicrobia bacterium]|nr:phosphoribosylformylglycinamidine synthase subunit PurQ [Verrucomicrobiota bacterium]
MRAAVIRFPGSNCDQDCHHVLREIGFDTDFVWHKEASAAGYDLIVLPGGFSYGDYLRCGAIARFSPVMKSIIEQAAKGVLVLGICNGFQILCESGLLPGALIRNRDMHFICEHVNLRVENTANPFLSASIVGAVLRVPIAHGEGNYTADAETLRTLNAEGRVLARYCDAQGRVTPEANPNGAAESIAGICNARRNVFGLMPHPERACDAALLSTDGRVVFESLVATLGKSRAA